MKLSKTGLTFLLGTAITSAAPAPLFAQTCSQVVADLQAKTAALNREARENGLNFLRDEAVDAGLSAAKRRLDATGDPTVDAYNQVADAREKVEAWAARMNAMGDFFVRLKACVASNCSLLKFHAEEMQRIKVVEAVREQLNEWVQSLGDSGITAAAERVNKASSLVSNVFGGARATAEGGFTGAVNCMNQYARNAATAPADPVSVGVPAGGPASVPPGGGSGVGKIVAWTAIIGGGALAGAYAAGQTGSDSLTSSPNTTTTTTTNNPTPVSNTPASIGLGPFNCSQANQTSNFRSCVGTINVRAGTLIGARQGQMLSAVTQPSVFVGRFTAPSSGGTTGTVELRATVASCPVQTSVLFSLDGSSVSFESIPVMIAVNCP